MFVHRRADQKRLGRYTVRGGARNVPKIQQLAESDPAAGDQARWWSALPFLLIPQKRWLGEGCALARPAGCAAWGGAWWNVGIVVMDLIVGHRGDGEHGKWGAVHPKGFVLCVFL